MPEKNISEIPRGLREQYEKGVAAFRQNNMDYALQLLAGVLKAEPAFYAGRDALRKAQLKKAGAPTGGFFKKVLGSASAAPLLTKAKMEMGKNPLDAIATAEQVLNSDPRNAMAHRIIAEAARAADLPRTAVLSLETLWSSSPEDREMGLALAESYMDIGLAPKAEEVFTALERTFPGDPRILMAHKNLSARRTLDEQGYAALASGQGSYRDVLKNKEEAISLEQGQRGVKDEKTAERLLHEFEARLQAEPQNMKLARDIAEIYVQQKNYDRALEYYQFILQSGGAGDAAIEKSITDLTLRKHEQARAALDPEAPDYAEQKARLDAERTEFQLADTLRRIERYPTDLQIRFELGVLYFQAGKVNEAIQEFQKAQANPNRRLQAMNFLGQCFARRGMHDMAARKLQEAIKEKPLFDDEKKDLVYNLAGVLEQMGKPEDAVKELEQIYQEDIGYRDVAARVDAFHASRA